jgi:PPP family 3-phenylpropionic acid transporter
MATVSEWPIMFFSDRLLAHLKPGGLLILALLLFCLRTFAYALVQAPQLILAVQLLHGPTFAAMWMAGVAYANELAPDGLGATAQGLFSGVTMGLGSACGAMTGGWLYEYFGCVSMFRWAGTGMFFGLILFVLANRLTGRSAQNRGS